MTTTVPHLDTPTLLEVCLHLNLMFMLTDEAYVIQFASPELESLLARDLEGQELSEAIPVLAGIDQELSQIARHKAKPWRIRGIQLTQAEKSQYDVLIMHRGERSGLLLAVWPIDIQSSVEQALRQQRNELTLALDELSKQSSALRTANDRLASLDRERRALLNLIAQDVKSSVSVITGYADWLSDHMTVSTSPGSEVALAEIKTSALHMTDLVKNALDLESIEQKLAAIEWQQLDLPAQVQTIAAMWQSMASMRNVNIAVEVEVDASEIEADVELLQQALQMLFERFLNLASAGSQVFIHISAWDNWAVLRFELSSPKTSRTQQQSHQEDFSEERMDLQLALVRSIIEGHGGHLSFKDDEGQGSILSLWLLRKHEHTYAEQDENQDSVPPSSDLRIVGQGSIRIHTASQKVWVDKAAVSLTTIEYRLLLYLAEHVDQVVSHDQMTQAVWSQDEQVSIDNLRVLVWRLRQKLSGEEGKTQYLRTVRGFGYILVS